MLWDGNQWIFAPLIADLYGSNNTNTTYKPKRVAGTMNLANLLTIAYRDGGEAQLRAVLADAHARDAGEQRDSTLAQAKVLLTFFETTMPVVREFMHLLENAPADPALAFDKIRELLPKLLVLFQATGHTTYASSVGVWLSLLVRLEVGPGRCYSPRHRHAFRTLVSCVRWHPMTLTWRAISANLPGPAGSECVMLTRRAVSARPYLEKLKHPAFELMRSNCEAQYSPRAHGNGACWIKGNRLSGEQSSRVRPYRETRTSTSARSSCSTNGWRSSRRGTRSQPSTTSSPSSLLSSPTGEAGKCSRRSDAVGQYMFSFSVF